MPINTDQTREIELTRMKKSSTLRPTVPKLEEILYAPFKMLDHGFIRVVDYMGDDAAIVQAARVSYGSGTKKVSEDRGLINYLMRHRHSTPFEMCEIKYHVKLPIFVARQWIRHRTANVNEYSARYSVLDKEFYLPEPENLAVQSTSNRQGRGNTLNQEEAAVVLDLLKTDASRAYDGYTELLNDDGTGKPRHEEKPMLARELARMNLTLNYYTQWYWKIDLYNLMHFLGLRADAHAQMEIRVYAEKMLEIMDLWVPYAAGAFREYRLGAHTLSATQLSIVKRFISGERVTAETSGLQPREWREFASAMELKIS
ncbi:MAG: FAD-dependent thymidylate synthase [Patescibacteria group bacterium]